MNTENKAYYMLVHTPQEYKDKGFVCDFFVKNTKTGVMFPCSPANFVRILNGGSSRDIEREYES